MTVHAAKKSAGFTAADKKYNQVLEQAAAIQPIQFGDKTKASAALKRLLTVAGYGSMLAKNAEFGGGTKNAVMAFQQAAGLPVTGQVDAGTVKSLERLLLHMRKNGQRFAGIGQRSNDIKAAEARMKRLGYDVGKVDGVYDQQSAKAVAAFRKDEGGGLAKGSPRLTELAEKTLRKESAGLSHDVYRQRVKPTKERKRLDALTAKEAGKNDGVGEGDKGRAVLNIQAHLRSAGFDPKHVDGKFDERTRGALEAFQRHAKLPVTGRVDDRTWKALEKARILSSKPFAPMQARNERDNAVKGTQKVLRKLGYKNVRVNGLFDRSTERAVRAFEKKNKLTVDGKVSAGEFAKMKKIASTPKFNLNTVQGCAQYLLKSKNVSFWSGLSTGSDRKNLERLARGQKAFVPAKGWSVTPKLKMMQALVAMAKRGRIMINALTGGVHSPNSNHYRGTAVDLDLSTGNAGMIESIARRYGGVRNFETDHIHLDF